MSRLLGSKGGRIVFGLLAIGFAIVMAVIPQSEDYTSVYNFGSATVNCGSLGHRQVSVDANVFGSDFGDLDLYGAPIFEGKTAEQVCDGKLNSIKIWVIGGGVVGGIALLVGFATPSSGRATLNQYRPSGPSTPVSTPARPAKKDYRPDPNPSWAQAGPPASGSGPPASAATSGAAMNLPPPPTRAAPSGAVPFASKPPQAAPVPMSTAPTGSPHVPPPTAAPSAPSAPSAPPGPVPGLPISYPVSLSVPGSGSHSLPSPPVPLSSYGAPPPPDFEDDKTEYRPPAAPQSSIAVAFDNGDLVQLTSTLSVGRNPAPFQGGAVHHLADPSISKTHLVIGRSGDQVWVEDRGSVNGTEVHSPGAESTEAVHGERVQLARDSSVSFGDSSFSIRHA